MVEQHVGATPAAAHDRAASPRTIKRLSRSRLDRVTRYVHTNIDKSITPAKMADVAALSPFHFARAFKATTGLSPMRFVWKMRIELAMALIQVNDDASLLSIAIACGFATQSHFTEVFKRYAGTTPSAWRRQVAVAAALALMLLPRALRVLKFLSC